MLSCYFLWIPSVEDEDTGNFHLLSLATGLKCLPLAEARREGIQVVDMHAEILARRELKLLLMDGLEEYLRLRKEDDQTLGASCASFALQTLLTLTNLPSSSPSFPSIARNQKAKLFLYSSHNLCGAASAESHAKRIEREDATIRDMLGFEDIGGRDAKTQELDAVDQGEYSPS